MTTFRQWVKAAGHRAVKTAAQTFGSMVTVGAAFAEIEWAYVLSATGVAFIASIATSLAGIPEVEGGASVARITKKSSTTE